MGTVRKTIQGVLDGTVGYEAGLDVLAVAPPSDVDPVLFAVLEEACARLWRGGWQPVELHRVVARRGHLTHAHLVTDAVAAHLARFPDTAVDEQWRAQAESLGAQRWWSGTGSYFTEAGTRWRLDRVAVLDIALTLLAILSELPAIEVLIPPPGSTKALHANRSPGEVRLLERVRALLAKAESSTFPAEAEAYTAKAQELVSRYSIDEALVAARSDSTTVVPFASRIGVDHPYEGEKAALLHAVAEANRCATVWSPEFGFATVFGYDADIDAVDLLYTSLLVQAHRAMARSEPPGGKAGRARLKTFRQSFLVAFAVRIGERLTSAADAAVAEVAGTADLLPVLAARDREVRESLQRVFPNTVRGRGSRVESLEGWDSGRAAADKAALHNKT